jgi:hypothetical protein
MGSEMEACDMKLDSLVHSPLNAGSGESILREAAIAGVIVGDKERLMWGFRMR